MTQPEPTPLHPAFDLPVVRGHCPACGAKSLFLGHGGYVTCGIIRCPEPDAATTVLERRPEPARQDGHTGPCEPPCCSVDPRAAEHENGPHTPAQPRCPACARPSCGHGVDHHIYDAHTRSLRECVLCNCPEPPEPAHP